MQVLTPDLVKPGMVIERKNPALLEKQARKETLEKGMKVRLYFNTKYNKSKAEVIAVGRLEDILEERKRLEELNTKQVSKVNFLLR